MEGREDQVAGERSLDADFSGLEVSNLADHDRVRVLTEKAAQRGGEAQPDPFADLHLVDSGEIEFDRILGGAQIV